ncbi:hypothetical protein [Salinicola aestuarinus]|uniref:hypothetical protein n=1 Tax=Salinicola aestuarinus TaxID=1949082 RepID=UPI000DA25336|nr:hypothetical protein [Salinicola aestuarinus]
MSGRDSNALALPDYVREWRDRLLTRGWRLRDQYGPPCDRMIEYHALYRGELYSGRVTISRTPETVRWGDLTNERVLLCNEPGAVQVWRFAEPGAPAAGPIKRQL